MTKTELENRLLENQGVIEAKDRRINELSASLKTAIENAETVTATLQMQSKQLARLNETNATLARSNASNAHTMELQAATIASLVGRATVAPPPAAPPPEGS